jgi:hypothetical protein
MAAPSTAINRFDLGMSYSEFSLEANRMKYIGLMVLPPVGVSQEAATFRKIEIASMLTKPEDTARAPRSGYNRSQGTWTTDSYSVQEHGVEEVNDDAENEMYGDIVRGEQLAVARGINRVLQSLENDIAQAVFNTSTWTGSALTTAVTSIGSSGNVAWSTKASADPIAHIDFAREKVKNNCGFKPNTVILTDTDFINCIRTDRIESLLKYDASQIMLAMNGQYDSKVLTGAQTALAGIFSVDQVLIGQSFKNTADDGQTPAFGRFWTSGYSMVCHINDDGMNGDLQSPTPTIGRTIWSTKNSEPLPGTDDAGFGSLIFDEYREENVRGSVFRPRNKRGIKILHPEAGHLLTGLSS